MFGSIVSNIKRKFSKTSEENLDIIVKIEKPGTKRGLHLFKLKQTKIDTEVPPVIYSDDTALSPRAVSTAGSAHTEIEWPILIDSNPNILDKFTRIVTLTDHAAYYDKNVCLCSFLNITNFATFRSIYMMCIMYNYIK